VQASRAALPLRCARAMASAELPPLNANRILLRSLKRTHEMYLSNYGQRPADNELAQQLRMGCKERSEFALVKDCRPRPQPTAPQLLARISRAPRLPPPLPPR